MDGQKGQKKSKKSAESIKVTDKMIEDWRAAMKEAPSPRLFREVTQAFKAAVATTKGEGGGQCRYKVADSSGRNLHTRLSYCRVSAQIIFGLNAQH